MTITLIPTVASTEGIQKEALIAELPTLDTLEEYAGSISLAELPILSFKHCTDEQGNVYEQLGFVVTARWSVNGNLWVAGAGFQVNYTDFITKTRNAFTQAL